MDHVQRRLSGSGRRRLAWDIAGGMWGLVRRAAVGVGLVAKGVGHDERRGWLRLGGDGAVGLGAGWRVCGMQSGA